VTCYIPRWFTRLSRLRKQLIIELQYTKLIYKHINLKIGQNQSCMQQLYTNNNLRYNMCRVTYILRLMCNFWLGKHFNNWLGLTNGQQLISLSTIYYRERQTTDFLIITTDITHLFTFPFLSLYRQQFLDTYCK